MFFGNTFFLFFLPPNGWFFYYVCVNTKLFVMKSIGCLLVLVLFFSCKKKDVITKETYEIVNTDLKDKKLSEVAVFFTEINSKHDEAVLLKNSYYNLLWLQYSKDISDSLDKFNDDVYSPEREKLYQEYIKSKSFLFK